jgi:hypothetical protein
MLSKKLVGTLGVLTATALAPATVAHAAPKPAPTDAARVLNLGTQVGSEGIRSPQADGIIAILIGAVSSPAAVSIAGRQIVPTRLEYPNLDGSSKQPASLRGRLRSQ